VEKGVAKYTTFCNSTILFHQIYQQSGGCERNKRRKEQKEKGRKRYRTKDKQRKELINKARKMNMLNM
jgi:hypothetical protein